jgi:diguanylate cyclase (GGDEF)-like protein
VPRPPVRPLAAALLLATAVLAALAAAAWTLAGDDSPSWARAGAVAGALLGAGALAAAWALARRTAGRMGRQLDRALQLARHDPLTGLANRRQVRERLDQELARARRAGIPVALVALDLDHFKRVNDTFGHAVGDEVLRATAQALRTAVRPGDTVGRPGGEEFVIVLPGADGEEALFIAERTRAAIAAAAPRGLQITCSAGVAVFPADAHDADALFDVADGALYAAKEGGRDQTRRFDPLGAGTGSAADQREDVLCVLREPHRLRPALQPVVRLADRALAGHEALARFAHHHERSPRAWFRLADRVGLGVELEVLAVARALAGAERPPGTFLALNVGPATLASPELAAVLPEDLTGLVFELTEPETPGRDRLGAALAELRRRGARLAVDDPAAGLEGLQRLARLAPDIVKVDRTLVDGVHADPAKAALVAALARFAASTGAIVCAQGIERPEELEALAELGVGLGQGFLLGRPESRPAP